MYQSGLLFLIEDETSDGFIKKIIELISAVPAATMLNSGICNKYYKDRQATAKQSGVTILFKDDDTKEANEASAALFKVSANNFTHNPHLQNEMFGPASLIVICKDEWELTQALQSLHGELTATVFGLKTDFEKFSASIDILLGRVGRVVYNGVPTGVEVGYAMVHGGPFPATTDARSTSVGAEAIKRFVRPICLQDCPHEFLPDALKNENSLKIMRKINGQYTKESL